MVGVHVCHRSIVSGTPGNLCHRVWISPGLRIPLGLGIFSPFFLGGKPSARVPSVSESSLRFSCVHRCPV
jgi:hypothetical protein